MEEIKAWLKRKKNVDEVFRIIPLREGSVRVFVLLPALTLVQSLWGASCSTETVVMDHIHGEVTLLSIRTKDRGSQQNNRSNRF